MNAIKTTGIVVAAIVVALAIAKAPVLDVEVNAQMQAEAAAMKAPEPCWDELPFRVALTQENIDRLCIKVQRPRPATAATRPVAQFHP